MKLRKCWRSLSRCEQALVSLFVLTLPLANPWVRGDGVGYYAYARAILIQRNLNFERDWLEANPTFRMGRTDAAGQLLPNQYTAMGHLDNHFTVGPALLWAPFLLTTHWAVLALDKFGAHIVADGFSRPYIVTMALATELYGFLGIFLSFRLARRYVEEKWAFLAALGIWFGSSLPVYMYFNPSWSHAHSAFAVALFLWYWDRTRGRRSPSQWALLGLCAGLMVNVYYPNAILVLLPLLESLVLLRESWQKSDGALAERLLAGNLLFAVLTIAALMPTFLTRQIIYGDPFNLGDYAHLGWSWTAPAWRNVLFSSDHGLLSWTPIVAVALLGLPILWRSQRALAGSFLLAMLAFYYLIACYPDWDGISSFGNRFFVSLTPIFVVGLAAALAELGALGKGSRKAALASGGLVGALLLWNLGFMFQWGTHMIPVRGPISWRKMAYNQVAVVPGRLAGTLKSYLTARNALMERIESEDIRQLKGQAHGNP